MKIPNMTLVTLLSLFRPKIWLNRETDERIGSKNNSEGIGIVRVSTDTGTFIII